MKINTTTIIFLLIIGLAAAGMFAYKSLWGSQSEAGEEETTSIIDGLDSTDPSSTIVKEKTETENNEEQLKETRIVKDDFEITLPAGWAEIADYPEILLMAVDTKEEVSEEILEKLDFRTNISIKSDDLGKYDKLNNAKEYAEGMKASLVQLISEIEFTHEEEGTIGGHDTFYVECESIQEGANFKTLLVFIVGNRNDIYAISLNTFLDSWPDYKDPFYQIAESFKFKYKLEF